MKCVETAPHEFSANYLFNTDGLQPFFGCNAVIKQHGGSHTGEFDLDGERWIARLSHQDSNIVNPGMATPQGTEFSIETIHEYRLKVYRHPEEDAVGQQSFTAHLAPRWPGMKGEKSDGSTVDIPVPDGFGEGVNVSIQGSNIEFERYEHLLAYGFGAVDVHSRYFGSPHESSNIRDAERYVRIHKDASGPIHSREGAISSLGHLLESDRTGYRKVVQNDDDEHGRNLPGYYHTVTLDPGRISEVWPAHILPKEIKHYYAREALSQGDSALAHPKLGASYQVNRWDETLKLSDLEKMNDELTETVRSVLMDSGLDVAPINGPGPFVEDAYFEVDLEEIEDEPTRMDVTHIRSEQESVVIRHLADGFSPVQWESLEYFMADGGTVSPTDIAEENDRHVGSVRRALREMEDMVERKYADVGLKSDFVAEMVHDAVQEARESTRRAVATSAKAIESAERGLSETMANWVAWAERNGVDISNRLGALSIDLGDLDKHRDPDPEYLVRRGLEVWTAADQDPARYRTATVRFNGRSTEAFRLL